MEIPERAKEILFNRIEKNGNLLKDILYRIPDKILEELWKAGLRNQYLRIKIFNSTEDQELIREVYNTKIEPEKEFYDSFKGFFYCPKLNPNIPKDILVDLYKITKEPYIIGHPDFPIETIINDDNKLNDDIDIAKSLAENPNCPPDLLRKLSEIDHYLIDRSIAKNKNTPIDVLKKFIELNVQLSEVAENPSIDGESLKCLYRRAIGHRDLNLRRRVLENPNCPEDLIRKALSSKSITDKMAIARNSKTPKDILIKLSNSKNDAVLGNLVNNPSCPSIVLLKLLSMNIPQGIKDKIKERLGGKREYK